LLDLLIALRDLPRLVNKVIEKLDSLETFMARFDTALADLDAQLDELVDYVTSDDETDAVEVEARAARIKAALATVRGEDAEAPAEGGEETVVDTAPDSQSAS
jgi:DNA integrity scanning protein DisA with diadenylate cyclase activity